MGDRPVAHLLTSTGNVGAGCGLWWLPCAAPKCGLPRRPLNLSTLSPQFTAMDGQGSSQAPCKNEHGGIPGAHLGNPPLWSISKHKSLSPARRFPQARAQRARHDHRVDRPRRPEIELTVFWQRRPCVPRIGFLALVSAPPISFHPKARNSGSRLPVTGSGIARIANGETTNTIARNGSPECAPRIPGNDSDGQTEGRALGALFPPCPRVSNQPGLGLSRAGECGLASAPESWPS